MERIRALKYRHNLTECWMRWISGLISRCMLLPFVSRYIHVVKSTTDSPSVEALYFLMPLHSSATCPCIAVPHGFLFHFQWHPPTHLTRTTPTPGNPENGWRPIWSQTRTRMRTRAPGMSRSWKVTQLRLTVCYSRQNDQHLIGISIK